MADNPDNKTAEDAEVASGGSKKNLIAFIGSVLFCVLSSVAVGILAFPDAGDPAHEPVEQAHEPVELIDLPIPKLTVNLADGRLLIITVTLEIEVLEVGEPEVDINALLPKVQDQLNKILSSLKEPSLTGGANMEFLQTRIKDHLNGGIFADIGKRVSNVYFIEWVLQ